jgi:hypothetical protein
MINDPATTQLVKKRKNLRLRIIIHRRFQFNFVIFLLVTCMVVVGFDILFYQFMVRRAFEAAEKIGLDASLVNSVLFPTSSLLSFALFSTLTTVLICVVCGLIVSHRIAGPIYRTLKVIEQLNSGIKFNGPIGLRRLDCFPELEKALNDLIKKIQS